MSCNTSNRSLIEGNPSQILERSLILSKNRRTLKESCLWGAINFGLFSLLLYDVSYICPFNISYYHYAEYTITGILFLNVLYYLYKMIKSSIGSNDQLTINEEQKKLLGVKDADPNYKIDNTPCLSPNKGIFNISTCSTPVTDVTSTSMNVTGLSWRSNLSESLNYSLSSPSWTYHKGSPDPKSISFANKVNPMNMSTFQDTSAIELIKDEDSLNQYLKDHEKVESTNKITNKNQQSANLLSSFWSHPVTKTAKDMSAFLKKCQYQISSQSPTKTCSSSPKGKIEDNNTGLPGQTSALEVWARINVDSVALTQWNENLRIWLSQTILERLVNEFDRVNDSLEKHGLADIKIGLVGLDRLRKTAQTMHVMQYIPSLGNLIPFLELHPNQAYLEKRIRELAKGGCISEFKWNGGSSYNGKEWDDSLPSDCTIIMHLMACYLDTQLMPLPNMPDTKPFSGHHYIRATDKMPVITKNSLFIHQISEKPPHFRVVVGDKVYEMIKGYNNLFHSILFFIHHINKVEHGMLGRVNLGRAGVNMLWIVEQ